MQKKNAWSADKETVRKIWNAVFENRNMQTHRLYGQMATVDRAVRVKEEGSWIAGIANN